MYWGLFVTRLVVEPSVVTREYFLRLNNGCGRYR